MLTAQRPVASTSAQRSRSSRFAAPRIQPPPWRWRYTPVAASSGASRRRLISPPRVGIATLRACGRNSRGGKMPRPARRSARVNSGGSVSAGVSFAGSSSRSALNARVSARTALSTSASTPQLYDAIARAERSTKTCSADCRQPAGTVPKCDNTATVSPQRGRTCFAAAYRGTHRTNSSLRTPKRRLPRDDARSRSHPDLPRCRGSPHLSRATRLSGTAVELAPPRRLLDGEPLPPRHRDDVRTTLPGDASPERRLRAAIQPTLRTQRTPLRRPLPRIRHRQRRLPHRCLPIRRQQPGPRRIVRARARLAVERKPLRARRRLRSARRMTQFEGSQYQNEIYSSGESPWPVGADDWEQRARAVLGDGPFGYIAGGAGSEATMRANREAFERRRLRPHMLTGNIVRDLSVQVLGTRSPFPFFLAPVGEITHDDIGRAPV